MARKYITIVSGLPRSGTSMMMKMINDGGIPALIDEVRKADDDNPKGYFEFEPVKKTKENAAWVPTGVGKVVKMVHVLLLDMPKEGFEYRVIFMRRHLDEVIKSQDIMLERSGKDTGNLPAEKIKDVFLKQIDKVYKYLDEQPAFKWMPVDYNEIMANPGPSVDAIHSFLGGDMDREAMMSVVDPSLYRNRK